MHKGSKSQERSECRWKHVAVVEDQFLMKKTARPEAFPAPEHAATECAVVGASSTPTAEVPDAGIVWARARPTAKHNRKKWYRRSRVCSKKKR